MTLTAEPYRGSTNQRTVGAEFGRCDYRALRVLQIGHPVDLDLGSSEERVAEPQGDRTGDHRQLQIEQIGNRTDGSADEPAGPDAFGFVGRFGGTARAGGDAGAADLGLQHALHMGVEVGALGFDHDMTDVAGIACVAVEQSAVEGSCLRALLEADEKKAALQPPLTSGRMPPVAEAAAPKKKKKKPVSAGFGGFGGGKKKR